MPCRSRTCRVVKTRAWGMATARLATSTRPIREVLGRLARPFARLGETQLCAGDVVGVDLDAQPLATQGLGDLARDVAAAERVEDRLAFLRQEANEEVGQLRRKTRGMNRQAGLA